ncbi:UDP-N-acetylmuramoyl-L-alanyl-D-glutamate--2,6-diaminopimelate ligase, partial [Patescibacteria group bacterium]
DKLIVIGVTGTNGKTTTVNLITNMIEETGEKVGMMSTINFKIADKEWTNVTKQTTQSPFFVQKMLKKMVNEKCRYAVIEVSSHAVTQSRIWGINFDLALVTNVTPDHVEYHGSFDNYLDAKGHFFKQVSKGKRKYGISKIMIMNADDKYYNYFDKFVADRKLTYGLKSATIYASEVEMKPKGSSFNLHVPNNVIEMNFRLPGEFNIYNCLAAASVGIALNIDLQKIKSGLEKVQTIAGRFEHVNAGQPFSVIVDYAHTPESLESLFSMYQKLTSGRVFAVFGATGGGRDKSKRPKMGEVVNEYADYIIVTDDDPYEEDEWKIIEQVSEGIPRKEGKDFWKISDRKQAIRLALSLAEEDDTVVIAGKGAEEVIMIGEKAIPWNDKQVVKELLNRKVEFNISDEEWI